MRWLESITDSVHMNLSKLRGWWRTEEPCMLKSAGSQRVRFDLTIEQQLYIYVYVYVYVYVCVCVCVCVCVYVYP